MQNEMEKHSFIFKLNCDMGWFFFIYVHYCGGVCVFDDCTYEVQQVGSVISIEE